MFDVGRSSLKIPLFPVSSILILFAFQSTIISQQSLWSPDKLNKLFSRCIFDKLSGIIENIMEKRAKEWLIQSDYDMDTAMYMHKGNRHIYAVFMCHLSIEKALKGLYHEKRREIPPKSHNLIYLLNEIGIKPPGEQGRFIVKLNEASVPTRYPENLARLQQVYSEIVVRDILAKAKELVIWIKKQLKKS